MYEPYDNNKQHDIMVVLHVLHLSNVTADGKQFDPVSSSFFFTREVQYYCNLTERMENNINISIRPREKVSPYNSCCCTGTIIRIYVILLLL